MQKGLQGLSVNLTFEMALHPALRQSSDHRMSSLPSGVGSLPGSGFCISSLHLPVDHGRTRARSCGLALIGNEFLPANQRAAQANGKDQQAALKESVGSLNIYNSC